ncbi:MAG: hypothetical protein HQ488_02835, partial [Parcubacteria group bacterium]|nr:hypothetical protein [Parcubacteria group bacterium]
KQNRERKKAETISKRQEKQKTTLIEFLQESPNIGTALSKVGINRSTYSRWRSSDPVFTTEADHAIEQGIAKTADVVEIALLNKARDGDVRAQKYYLDNNHDRYKPRHLNDAFNEHVLTEERKKQIADAMRNWSMPTEGDERDEDYYLGSGPDAPLTE